MMRQSIRIRLLFGLTITIVSLWIVMLAATYYGAQREVGALFDTQLEQAARVATRTMLGLPPEQESERQDESVEASDQYQKNLVLQVWNDQGELLLHSDNAPLVPLSTLQNGFENTTINETRWRIFSFYDQTNRITVHTGEPLRPRRSLTQHVVRQTVYPVLVALPLVTLLIWLVVTGGFSPLKRLASELHRRDPENLTTMDAPYAPSEVRPLIEELNSLLHRLKDRMQKERHFIGDAAHELRTPLSGLRVQAEVALGARNAQESQRALNQILVGVDRASHLVNQLLTLSRIDENHHLPTTQVDLDQCLRNVLQDTYSAAHKKDIELDFDNRLAGPAMVQGLSDGLYVLFRNLVDNSIKYSPSGSRVQVCLTRSSNRFLISVSDQGPGIPEAEHAKVFDRFHRRNKQDSYGTGLGLSIVRRVVEIHGGDIQLSKPQSGSGLEITVSFSDPTPGQRHSAPSRDEKRTNSYQPGLADGSMSGTS